MASLQLAGHLATSTPSTTLWGRHIGCASTMAVKGSNFYAALMNLSLEDEAAAAAKAVRSPSKAAAASSIATGSRGKAAAVETAASSRTQQQQRQPSPQQSQDEQQQPSEINPKPKRKRLRDPLVWIDLEMTGLDLSKDTIIEIACLVTDGDLTTVIEGPCMAIHHSDEVLEGMNEWCKEHHGASGLTQRVRDSTIDMAEAQTQVLEFIKEHTEYQSAQLAGNSVHVDKAFLRVHMPEVVEHLHYRIVDVSTVQELCRRWAPKLHRSAPKKVAAHTALSDIKESLKELQYYKQVLWKHR